jgi:transcriptional regulator with XRE-family HTH domain
MSEYTVTHALRELRTRAKVSLREMARQLGKSTGGYGHYEDPSRFKDPYLPMQLALEIAAILERHGVKREEVIALAGADAFADAESVDARVSKLSPERRRRFLDYLADLEAAEAASRETRVPASSPDDQAS